jgi:hypothetical protein
LQGSSCAPSLLPSLVCCPKQRRDERGHFNFLYSSISNN